MNVTNLILNLKAMITDNSFDQQMVSKAIKALELGAIETILSYSDLPDAATNRDKLYYIKFDGLYKVDGNDWIPFSPDIRLAYGWGRGVSGIIGDNASAARSSPVSVVGDFTDWINISAGTSHSLAVKTDGTAWGWGTGACGVIGDNATAARSSPVSVVGGFTDWCQVSAGGFHSLGVRTNGTAWAWGSNGNGRLGDNTTAGKCSPISVIGGFTDWCQVSAGVNHSLGLRSNGTAWAWGLSGSGRLGDNSVADKSSPVSVVGGFTDWCQVSAGVAHSLGLRSNGTAWAWGTNGYGQLGDNSITNRSSPVSVVGDFTDWCQVSGGNGFSAGVRTNGTAWAWGLGTRGQLGDNTAVTKSSPVSVVGGFTDWCQVTAGASHSLGVRTNGTAWGWGCNTCGQLGDGTIVSKRSPVLVAGGFTDWYKVSSSAYTTLGIRRTIS